MIPGMDVFHCHMTGCCIMEVDVVVLKDQRERKCKH